MIAAADRPAAALSGLAALLLLVRFHGIDTDHAEIRRRFGDKIGVPEMLRCGRKFGLKARADRSNWRRLIKAPLPCIAVLRDGRCLLLVEARKNEVLALNPSSPRTIAMSRAEFEAIWDGRIILMARRTGLMDLVRRFGHRLFRRRHPIDSSAAAQSKLAALALLLRFCGITANLAEIRHHLGNSIGVPEMVRCAKEFGLWARTYRSNWRRLSKAPLPCIALLRDGRCLFLVQADENAVVALNPTSSRTISMSGAEFETIWDRRLILMARRTGLADLALASASVGSLAPPQVSQSAWRCADRLVRPPSLRARLIAILRGPQKARRGGCPRLSQRSK